ncbi:MAG: hypothetical protein WCV84_03770 [Patescibacteria group bacterium]
MKNVGKWMGFALTLVGTVGYAATANAQSDAGTPPAIDPADTQEPEVRPSMQCLVDLGTWSRATGGFTACPRDLAGYRAFVERCHDLLSEGVRTFETNCAANPRNPGTPRPVVTSPPLPDRCIGLENGSIRQVGRRCECVQTAGITRSQFLVARSAFRRSYACAITSIGADYIRGLYGVSAPAQDYNEQFAILCRHTVCPAGRPTCAPSERVESTNCRSFRQLLDTALNARPAGGNVGADNPILGELERQIIAIQSENLGPRVTHLEDGTRPIEGLAPAGTAEGDRLRVGSEAVVAAVRQVQNGTVGGNAAAWVARDAMRFHLGLGLQGMYREWTDFQAFVEAGFRSPLTAGGWGAYLLGGGGYGSSGANTDGSVLARLATGGVYYPGAERQTGVFFGAVTNVTWYPGPSRRAVNGVASYTGFTLGGEVGIEHALSALIGMRAAVQVNLFDRSLVRSGEPVEIHSFEGVSGGLSLSFFWRPSRTR